MDAHRFDALIQRLGAAGSRRQALATLIAAATTLVARLGVEDAAAKCKGYKGKCKSKSNCCGKDGLRCRHGKCRCKKGWQHCSTSGKGCTPVKSDPDNCGACGHECPAEAPCCIDGACQETCGGSCCASCFIDYLDGVTPQPDSETCCGPGTGTICSSKKHDTSDDECCWPDQECVNGECCGDGILGAVICGGKCCPASSCCNNECCPDGQICGMMDNEMACVSASRDCNGNGDCLPGEICHGGICCSGDRVCGDGVGGDVCCSAGEWCDDAHGGIDISCCAVGTQCHTTWRGHRVRR